MASEISDGLRKLVASASFIIDATDDTHTEASLGDHGVTFTVTHTATGNEDACITIPLWALEALLEASRLGD